MILEDTDIFAQILGIVAPWRVASVKLNTDERKVDIYLEHDKEAHFECPKCGESVGVYHHAFEGTWLHLDVCQFHTFLHTQKPVISCPKHGWQFVKVPWAEDKNLPKPAVTQSGEETPYFGEVEGETATKVRIWFDSRVAHQIIGRRWSPNQKIEHCSDGAIILTLETQQPDKVVSWVLGFGPNASLQEPKELLWRVYREAKAMWGMAQDHMDENVTFTEGELAQIRESNEAGFNPMPPKNLMARWGKYCANENIAREAVGILEYLWQTCEHSMCGWDLGDLKYMLEEGHVVGIGQGRASGPKRSIKAAELARADLARYENALDAEHLVIWFSHSDALWQEDMDDITETYTLLLRRADDNDEPDYIPHWLTSYDMGKDFGVTLVAISTNKKE